MSKPSKCPSCGSNEALYANIKVPYDLDWRGGEYRVGKRSDNDFYLPSSPDRDATCGCGNCGWEGAFRELKVPMAEFTVTLKWTTPDGDVDTDVIEQRAKLMAELCSKMGANIHDKVTVTSVTAEGE
mgnify:FL=1